ncbi:MAG: Flp pilus assembly protein CpaB [Actinobacteria bacterium]|nr:Flp pilus assembly protein CpaB [Actinomycetota bacterium]
MKARGLVLVVAFLLATTATAAVFMYVRGVREEASSGGDQATVIVSKRDIPAGSDMDALIASGAFESTRIARESLVKGAVTSLSQLEGRRATVPILAGEQISTARLQGSTELPGGALGIPEGFQAVSIQLEAPRVAGGAVQQGDRITVFATFQDVQVIQKDGTRRELGDYTVTLVPDVQVLRVATPGLERGAENVVVTMALLPRDAEKLVFAQENGTIWLSLLPPEGVGVDQAPVQVGQLIGR